MRKITLRFYLLVFVFLFSFGVVRSALAHGDEPRLEISAERVNPGGVIEVRGVDFEFEEVVALVLVGDQYELPLGDIVADTEGIFLQIVTLPVDLNEGEYHFRAITDDHEILSPTLTVQGPAISEEGEGQRAEEESLLAPVPTHAPGVSSTAMPQVPANETTAESNPSPNIAAMTFVVVIVILVAFGVRFLIKR